jgi:predicted DNA-binding transcriptional regulator AlpA
MLMLLPLARRNSHRRRKPRPSHKLPKPPQLLPIEEVMLRSGVGRTALDGQIKAGTFPAPAKVGSSSRWFSQRGSGTHNRKPYEVRRERAN